MTDTPSLRAVLTESAKKFTDAHQVVDEWVTGERWDSNSFTIDELLAAMECDVTRWHEAAVAEMQGHIYRGIDDDSKWRHRWWDQIMYSFGIEVTKPRTEGKVFEGIERALTERDKRIVALQAEHARLTAAQDWQPIETAPKDGETRIFACWQQWGTFEIVFWSDYRKAWCASDGGWGSDRWRDENAPTHWRPLPAPPGAAE